MRSREPKCDAQEASAAPNAGGKRGWPVESYGIDPGGRRVVRSVRVDGRVRRSSVPLLSGAPRSSAEEAFDWCWLRMTHPPRAGRGEPVRAVDLFSGCGMMSLGAAEAARGLGRGFELLLAVDSDDAALRVCRRAFPGATTHCGLVESLIERAPGAKSTASERILQRRLGNVELLMGGPPCQGHSNFNNHTRGRDDRNGLGLKLVRLAELVRPTHLIVENVEGILLDRGHVLPRMQNALIRLGYATARKVLKAERLGVAQRRHRMFLVATLDESLDVEAVVHPRELPERPFRWACADLAGRTTSDPIDVPAVLSDVSRRRIDYLFDEALYDLPDSERPPCHRHVAHRYKSVYGRLRWGKPAQTITTGFRCMGQGRFVHPKRRRTLTGHEAARLQSIPDFVDFSGVNPSNVAKLIGNAVPPRIAYALALRLLT